MTPEEKEKSYDRHVQYRKNRARYEAPAGAAMFVAIVGGIWILFKTGFSFNALIFFIAAVVFGGAALYGLSERKKEQQQDEELNEDIKMSVIHKEDKNMDLKSTDAGYVNKNNQKNIGRTDEPGTDNEQWFYEMECLNCGHKYKANGSDIWQRKCPNCQGGKP